MIADGGGVVNIKPFAHKRSAFLQQGSNLPISIFYWYSIWILDLLKGIWAKGAKQARACYTLLCVVLFIFLLEMIDKII